jgi:replication factor A1
VSFEEILKEIVSKSGLSEQKILEKINEKYEEFSGLITKEGAAYIVARDLGIDLSALERKRRLQIKNIFPGMKNINVIGRVFKISPITEFSRQNGTIGRVCNVFIGDETGFFRLPLWNDQVGNVEDRLVQEGDVVQITNGVARENIFGDIEISLGKYGNIRVI